MRDIPSARQEPYEYEIVVVIPRGEDDPRWYPIETGLGAMIDEDKKQILVPFWDGVSAEEAGRIVTGSIRRELA